MSLDSNLILQKAIENTDLNDFGDEIFIEGLHKLVSSINNEASLNEVGFQAQEHRILGLLINLLRTVDALKNNPEILEQDIISPIVIVGLPRTGSTMTHRLLASDPNHTAMLWWEGRYPAILPSEVRGNPQERMQLGEAEVAAVVEASPEALKIHPWDFNGADEEILLIEHTFLSTVPESCMHLPSYSTWIEEQDHKVVYEFLKKQIQYLIWQNPGREQKRWVLKSPHHLGFIDKVLDVFPDAKVIQTHRTPVDTVPSFGSMCANLSEQLTTDFNKQRIARHWQDKLCRVLEHCQEISSLHGDSFIHLDFKKMISEPLEEMKKIYTFIHEDFADQTENAMKAWQEENKHEMGSHKYSLEEYGLSKDEIEEKFKMYIDAYIGKA